ncbi:MFS transporter [Streptomyces diastatochromogenes]|nr:MFS transporter [Streptomyces diastatochromogenes]
MAETLPAPAPDTRTEEGAWRLLFVLSGNMVLDAIEVSVVLVALPTIAADLHLSIPSVQWLMTGFALGFAALLLLGPRLTARWGLRRCYLAALLVFAAASVVGGLADAPWLLVAARVVKGGCAALTAPAGLTLIAATFPEGPRLRRAVSVYALFGAFGFTLGLLLSGALTGASWRWTLLFPAPVALILLVWGLRVIPHTGRRPAPRLGLALLRRGPCSAPPSSRPASTAATPPCCCSSPSGRPTASAGPLAVGTRPAARLRAPRAVRRLRGAAHRAFRHPGPIVAGAAAALAGQALFLLHPHPRSYATDLLPTLLLVGTAFVLAFAALNLQATGGLPPRERGSAVPCTRPASSSAAS